MKDFYDAQNYSRIVVRFVLENNGQSFGLGLSTSSILNKMVKSYPEQCDKFLFSCNYVFLEFGQVHGMLKDISMKIGNKLPLKESLLDYSTLTDFTKRLSDINKMKVAELEKNRNNSSFNWEFINKKNQSISNSMNQIKSELDYIKNTINTIK